MVFIILSLILIVVDNEIQWDDENPATLSQTTLTVLGVLRIANIIFALIGVFLIFLEIFEENKLFKIKTRPQVYKRNCSFFEFLSNLFDIIVCLLVIPPYIENCNKNFC